jgi:hypothetical protein
LRTARGSKELRDHQGSYIGVFAEADKLKLKQRKKGGRLSDALLVMQVPE